MFTGARTGFNCPDHTDSQGKSVSKSTAWPVLGAPVLTALVLSACVAPPLSAPDGPPPPTTTGQALAQLACPHRIAEAAAWVNHMPGPNRSPRQLIVDVRLAEATDTAVILKSAASTGDTLVLEIRTAPTAPVPGRLGYREPVPDPLPKKISFFCRGGEVFALDKIDHVY